MYFQLSRASAELASTLIPTQQLKSEPLLNSVIRLGTLTVLRGILALCIFIKLETFRRHPKIYLNPRIRATASCASFQLPVSFLVLASVSKNSGHTSAVLFFSLSKKRRRTPSQCKYLQIRIAERR
jgi:hypothetical protein